MRPKGSAQELEVRRRLAGRLLLQGKGIHEVARLVGASPSAVHRWKCVVEREGLEGLRAKPHPGPHPRLKEEGRGRVLQSNKVKKKGSKSCTQTGGITPRWIAGCGGLRGRGSARCIIERLDPLTIYPSLWEVPASSNTSCRKPSNCSSVPRNSFQIVSRSWRSKSFNLSHLSSIP